MKKYFLLGLFEQKIFFKENQFFLFGPTLKLKSIKSNSTFSRSSSISSEFSAPQNLKCKFSLKFLFCLKINLKAFVTAFDKPFVLHFLDCTINLVAVGIFGSQCIKSIVLKLFSTSPSDLLEKVMLPSITSSFTLFTSYKFTSCTT